jgi:TonB-dependent SusC/RagA subfamily outer membrane receptor
MQISTWIEAARVAAPFPLALLLALGCSHASRAVRPMSPDGGDSVAVGYGVRARGSVTETVASVDVGRDAVRPRVTRIEELLDGRVAGLEVRSLPNGDLSVRIRGALGEPLWVIDGIPAPGGVLPRALLADIHPSDVARIDVLKGSAAAVYGMRGHNGVILVTLRTVRR